MQKGLGDVDGSGALAHGHDRKIGLVGLCIVAVDAGQAFEPKDSPSSRLDPSFAVQIGTWKSVQGTSLI